MNHTNCKPIHCSVLLYQLKEHIKEKCGTDVISMHIWKNTTFIYAKILGEFVEAMRTSVKGGLWYGLVGRFDWALLRVAESTSDVI
jgi:hypothetical protein